MPIFTRIIDEVMTHIIHPVSEQMGGRLIERLGFKELFDNNIYFTTDDSKASNTKDKRHNAKITTDRCDINIVPMLNPAEVKWDALNFKSNAAYNIFNLHRYEDNPIFVDKRADISLHEQLVPLSIQLEMNFKFKSKEHAYRLVDAIYNKHFTSGVMENNTIIYDYPFPTDVFKIMYMLFKMRKFEPEISFKDYLIAGSKKDISYISNRYGTDLEIIVQKNNALVLAQVEFNKEKPDAELIDQFPNFFSVDCIYSLQLPRPNMIHLKYPVVVDNSLIHQVLVPAVDREHPTNLELIRTDRVAQAYVYSELSSDYPYTPVHFPMYDDWRVPQKNNPLVKYGYKFFFTGAFTLDKDDDNNVIPSKIDLINDFPDGYKFHPIIIDSLKIQGDSSFGPNVLFNISVYANDERLDPEFLSLDENLVLTINATIPYKRYHIVVSELSDIKYLNPLYLPIVLKYHNFFVSTLIRNLQYLIKVGELVVIDGKIFTNKNRYVNIPGLMAGYDSANQEAYTYDNPYAPRYDLVEDYEQYQKQCIYTKKGQPILGEQGGPNGFNCPWRIGQYIIRPITE